MPDGPGGARRAGPGGTPGSAPNDGPSGTQDR